MGLRPSFDFSKPLPEKYESQMPHGVTTELEKYQWRELKLGELRIKGLVRVDENNRYVIVDDDAVASAGDAADDAISDKSDDNAAIMLEDSETTTQDILSEIGISLQNESASESNDAPDEVQKEESEDESSSEKDVKQSVTKSKSSGKARNIFSTSRARSSDDDSECIRFLSKSVMTAVRRIFPGTASKSDLISAVVYIFSGGDCEISDRAMELVNDYKSKDELTSVNERLSHLERSFERVSRRQLEMLQSIELCTCFNTFDRRYGSNEPRRSPKQTEFREKDNLDMLDRLREQAKDQLKMDDAERGRQIYNQIKDKNE